MIWKLLQLLVVELFPLTESVGQVCAPKYETVYDNKCETVYETVYEDACTAAFNTIYEKKCETK